jgi:hypothetical protein
MASTERWLFSFLFKRRGHTNLWDLAPGGDALKAPEDHGHPEHEVRIGAKEDGLVWIEVTEDLSSDANIRDAIDKASDKARIFFKKRYPDADLMP